jgi:hypothetical protein
MNSSIVPVLLSVMAAVPADAALRPPSVPLVAHSPYFSIWSASNGLAEEATRHWTGKEHRLTSLIRIDEKTYRLMGAEPAALPALPQKSLEVFPTRTVYRFENAHVAVALTFTSPLLPADLSILARPVTYVTWTVRSLDGKAHTAAVYLDAAAEITVNTPEQKVVWMRKTIEGLVAMRVGSQEQPVLATSGDDRRIDWGYLYLAAPEAGAAARAGDFEACAGAFAKKGKLEEADDTRMPRPAGDGRPVLALSLDLGRVEAAEVTRFAVLAYDEIQSIQYFTRNLQPYWCKDGLDAAGLLKTAAADHDKLLGKCAAFDREMLADLEKAGGKKYAEIAALAYRQAISAHGLAADRSGQPLFFSKENFSNGCIATVDVTYPSAPLFLLASPALMKGMLVPVLDYAKTERWKFPFAPHDLGTYPLANGQVYGGGEQTEKDQMPVEECGNMLILVAALAKIEGDISFADKYWPVLTKWAEYLAEKGFDPENQLCTDDFDGHLAHNVNLSLKAILGLGAHAGLAAQRGDQEAAQKYRALAEKFARQWQEAAKDGDHTKLAFDKPGTWSQKYNLVWDRLLRLDLFPDEIGEKEVAFYRAKQNAYGVPLTSRGDHTKLDWIVWSATLSGNRKDFEALVAPIWNFLNETPDRIPMTDWYLTREPKKKGFQARSVVGGVFIKLLEDEAMWKKWAAAGQKVAGSWAPQPLPPKTKELSPVAERWKYTVVAPKEGWFKAEFDDTAWKVSQAPFGTDGRVQRNTPWTTPDIWLRREFSLGAVSKANLRLKVVWDDDAEIYLNGVLAVKAPGASGRYRLVEILDDALAVLRPDGKNILAVHCHQVHGGQMIDAGLVEIIPQE